LARASSVTGLQVTEFDDASNRLGIGGKVPLVNRLDPAALQQFLREHPLWAIEAGTLARTYEFATFPKAIEFVQKVGVRAEQKNHHPDIDIRWRKVTLKLVTHDAAGLTELDTALAAECDTLA
jgi:4a-hydroxytetrahydrobiopterin dehydratase